MGNIIAIGGGEIGRPGFPVETTAIDKEIIRLSGQKRPRFLFLPTASSDSRSYAKVVDKHFGQDLGCAVSSLFLFDKNLVRKEIEKQIMASDIIYVGGGNTLKMLRRWRQLGVDRMLRAAHKRGIVLSGVSAGAICWAAYGNSDSLTFSRKDAPLIRVRGLNLIKISLCPHYDGEKKRPPDLKKMMRRTPGIAIALDNCAALEIIDNKFRIVTSKKSAGAYKAYWKNGKYRIKGLISGPSAPIEKLLIKD